jgi:hypothetical protein
MSNKTDECGRGASAGRTSTGGGDPDSISSSSSPLLDISSTHPGHTLLCGYLNKLSGKGPLRGFKKRWFVYSPSECKLHYYRAKGDLVPLGVIDIRKATFTINPQTRPSESSAFTFSIVTSPEQEYILEGVDQTTSLYWIRELQRFRKEYIVSLASNFGIKLSSDSISDGASSSNSITKHHREPQVIEVKKEERSSSVFYDELDEEEEALLKKNLERQHHHRQQQTSGGKVHPPPKRSVTEDSLSNRSRGRSANTGFTSSVFSRLKTRAESLTRLNSSATNNSSKEATSPGCDRCRDREEQLVSISDDLSAVENELQATREVVHLLQRQLNVVQQEKERLQSIIKSDGKGSQEMLKVLSGLESDAGEAKVKMSNLQRSYDQLKAENEKLQEVNTQLFEETNLLKDIVEAKDKTVINLTNEIFELESNGTSPNPFVQAIQRQQTLQNQQFMSQSIDECSSEMTKVDTSELDNLKDSVIAYKMQNEFLNQEVVAVNDLRLHAEKKQQELQLKIYEWEAKCCQVQSKLLSLLKEINQSITQSEQTHEEKHHPYTQENPRPPVVVTETTVDLVKRLLEDISLDIPLSWQKGNRKRHDLGPATKYTPEYDDLGFANANKYKMKDTTGGSTVTEDESEDEQEIGKRSRSESEVTNDTPTLTQDETSAHRSSNERDRSQGKHHHHHRSRSHFAWKSRWDSYVGSLGNQELVRSQELKLLLRSGIPREYRCKIWKGLINIKVKHVKEKVGEGYYSKLQDSKSTNKTSASKTSTGNYDPVVKQIELDLLRTLPNNKHFESLESDGTCRLRRVLIAYSRHNPKVGYCQGLNRLAAVSLLFMPEEDAFWALVTIIEHLMPPEYYSHNLLGAHVDQYVFRDLLAEKLPRVSEVLEKYGIEISLFSWFLTCFVDNIPVEVYLRIWDIFLYEGNKVLFRFALAFFKMYEEEILTSSDSLSINTLLRTLGETGCDVKNLCRIAFSFLNPFPMNRVRQKRAHYTAVVKAELERLDQLRKNLPSYGESGSTTSVSSAGKRPKDAISKEEAADSEDRESD